MSAHEERTLRSATKKMASESTPTSGDTTSVETNTWSNGTSGEQHGLGITASRPANVITSGGPAQPTAQPAKRHAAPVHEDDNESNETVLGNPTGGADTVSTKLSLLRAELELQDAELERAHRAAAAARSRLEIARIEASQPPSTAPPPDANEESRVVGWVEQHRYANDNAQINRHSLLPPPPPRSSYVPPRDRAHVNQSFVNRDLELLSSQVVEAVNRSNSKPGMQRHVPELPPFDGNITEWIAFRAEFDDTASLFTSVANIGRIRKALRGDARLAVRSIMYTVSDPYEIIEALERQFGDPEEIVLAEMHCVKRMPRLADDNSNITTFAAQIVPVEVSGPLGVVNTYALLDDGSSLTMIERHIADQVAPRTRSEPLSLEGVGGNVVNDQESCRVQLSIRGACSRNLEKITAYTIGKLNLAAQTVGRELIEKCEHLREIRNELCYDCATPTILVGQDHWSLLVSTQIRSGARDMPVASLTRLGWILHGKHEASRSAAFVVNHVKRTDSEHEILTLLKENFSIESLGIERKVPKTDPDQRAIDILNATCVINAKGTAYQAGLLWRSENESLPDNKNQAMKRLHNLENKLDKDESLKLEYTKQIKNLIEKGYAEVMESPPPPNSPRAWYLPHFPVFHAQKLKMRLVFDAASRAHGKCLNDALLTGPDLLQSLFGVLLRFREGKIAITADIREMFLQIEVEESDRDSLRFLWRGEERQSEPREYRMKKLIFGSACSPATALFVKNKNAKCNEKLYPEAAKITVRNSYMDDFLIALDSSEAEARRIINDVHTLNSLASFELTGFASNRPEVVTDVKSTGSDKKSTSLGVKSESERTLGLVWNHARDTLGFNVNLRNTPPNVLNGTQLPTKRQVTSSVMSVYDPLGYASPITVIGKALIQDIWRTGIGWDEPIKSESIPTWKSFIENVKLLKNLEIERYVPACEREGEIHTFCDASEKVYAAAVYFVSNEPGGGKSSRLVAAKARVAPLKTISIPRLELQGCVLGTRLTKTVVEQTDYKIIGKHFWSDSRTVLAWIKSDPRSFKSFVAHRLAEIEDTTVPTEWRWVPSALNTADDATKGVPINFDKNHRWFQGPDFIRRDINEWPVDKSAPALAPPTGEERPPRVVLATRKCDTYSYLPQIDRFSNFTRLIRSAATVLFAAEVFKAKMLKRKHEIEINRNHLRLAELLLVRRSQNISFSEDIRRLHRSEPASKGSPLRKVTAKLDNKGTLLLDSRIDRGTAIPILHAKEEFTRLLIAYYHAKFNHGNHKTVMNELIQRYHIVGLRGTLRYICENCQWCKTHKGKPLKLPYGDLPPERLMSNQPPFTATACDLFGPITITIGRRHEKRWGALFTCLTTRAVHMELVASLSAASLILALRRMMARRGTPTVIYSDNGTNFVGAEREISDALLTAEKQLKEFAEYKEITWKKIPPGNPSAGGAWERLVSSIKTALRATLHEKHPKKKCCTRCCWKQNTSLILDHSRH
ncbi:uncharacterized protein [Choristoneura fumiferana]|uniref:uncharacterized protein n=1 Tax=Choristoneura fumiferana TaxID=7141 RepID=UPI003D15C221